MKKIIKLSYFLFVSLAIVSCSSDDDDAETFTNIIEYDSNVVDVEEATIIDYKTTTMEGYYNYDFTLVGTSSEGSIYGFYVELLSKGTESFNTGTFEYFIGDEDFPDFYYSYADLSIDEDTYFEVVDGNIIVSGSGNNFSISGELTLENDEVVTINYSGEFTYYDGDDDITKVSSSPKSSRFFSVK